MPPTRTIPRTLTATLATVLLLAITTSTASARNLSFSGQNVRATWQRLEFASSLVTIRCSVTLEGSFHSRTIAKVRDSLIGTITRTIIKEETCTEGRARPLFLPWHIQYESFAGTLPRINAMNAIISRFRFLIIVPGAATGSYGTGTDRITGQVSVEASGAINGLAPVAGRNTMNRVEGSFFAPASGQIVGPEGQVTVLNSTTRVTLTLI